MAVASAKKIFKLFLSAEAGKGIIFWYEEIWALCYPSNSYKILKLCIISFFQISWFQKIHNTFKEACETNEAVDSVQEKIVNEKSEQEGSKETDSILKDSDQFKDDHFNEEFSRVS